MKFSKIMIASLLSMSFAFSTLATEKQHQMITVNASDNGPAVVSIKKDGNVQVYKISKEAFNDTSLLSEELPDVSQETIDHLTKALSNIYTEHDANTNIELLIGGSDTVADGNHVILHEVSDINIEGGSSVAFISVDGTELEIELDENSQLGADQKAEIHKVIEEMHIAEKDGELALLNIDEEHKNIKVIINKASGFSEGMPFELLKDMLKNTKLTQEQLNELQQLLDNKR